MKKIACFLACCLILSLTSLTVFASEPAVRVPEAPIALTQTQTNFEAVIEIEPENAYAGVEIAVACPQGVTVTGASSSSGSMSAGPVLANGLYWTSFFESDNQLSGAMKMTLQFSCPESFAGGSIQLQTVKVLTKNGVGVDTEELHPALEIRITRNGSEPIDPEPTESEPVDSEPATTAPSEDATNPTQNTEESGSGTGGGTSPDTSDGSNLTLWVALLVAGAVGMLGIAVCTKRKGAT